MKTLIKNISSSSYAIIRFISRRNANALLAVFSLFLIASCSSTYNTAYNDDVYFSRGKQQPGGSVSGVSTPVAKSASSEYDNSESESKFDRKTYTTRIVESEEQSIADSDEGITRESTANTSETASDGQGNTYITNNFYGDDYYDYEYASRLKRFHNRYLGLGYYDDYYTNMYWYTYDPFYWGTSIYMGYNWYWPRYYYYRPSWYWGFSIGWGLPGYMAWNPYYNYHWWNGYYPNYWNYNNYYDYSYYYYNSYDKGAHSYHRGDRAPVSSYKGKSSVSSMQNTDRYASFGDKYEAYVSKSDFQKQAATATDKMNTPAVKKETVSKGQILNSSSPSLQQPSTTLQQPSPVNQKDAGLGIPSAKEGESSPKAPAAIDRNLEKPSAIGNPNIMQPQEKNPSNNINKTPGVRQYSKPNINDFNRQEPKYSKPKIYTSPEFTQPKSGNYYTKPNPITMPEQGGREYKSGKSVREDRRLDISAPKIERNIQPRVDPGVRSNPSPMREINAPAPSKPSQNLNFNRNESRPSGNSPSNSGSSGGSNRRR